jgi:hypothetical protein
MKTKLEKNEVLIKGISSLKEGKFTPSETTRRIEYLQENILKKVSTRDGGWTILYLDESDGRYWELFYADDNDHDVGPPSLRNISEAEAKEKYKF